MKKFSDQFTCVHDTQAMRYNCSIQFAKLTSHFNISRYHVFSKFSTAKFRFLATSYSGVVVEEKDAEPTPPVTPVFQTQVLEESTGRSNQNITGKPGEILCWHFIGGS